MVTESYPIETEACHHIMNRIMCPWTINISSMETFLLNFVVILKHPLQNYYKILKTCFLRNMWYIKDSNLQHNVSSRKILTYISLYIFVIIITIHISIEYKDAYHMESTTRLQCFQKTYLYLFLWIGLHLDSSLFLQWLKLDIYI